MLFTISCMHSKWETISTNKFLSKNKIDSTDYNTLESLHIKGKLGKIITSNTSNNFCHFYKPLASYYRNVFVERYLPNSNKNIIIKFDYNGKAIDSLLINKSAVIINDYIIEKDSYVSWFIDNNKKIKKLENVNYFSESDTTKIKILAKSIKKNNYLFHRNNENSSIPIIDTCNYVIIFDNNKLTKYNYSKNIYSTYDSKIESDNSSMFSNNFKQIDLINAEKILKIDNFYSINHQKFIRGYDSGGFNINGGGNDPCERFYGTCFITIISQNNLKFKLNNQDICDNRDISTFSPNYNIYSEEFLNFYMITEIDIEKSVFYIIKK